MENFYVVFDKKYTDDFPHPNAFEGVEPHGEGWITFQTTEEDYAWRMVKMLFGDKFEDMFMVFDFDSEEYPRGELAVITEWDF